MVKMSLNLLINYNLVIFDFYLLKSFSYKDIV